MVARRTHNPKDVGSSPTLATNRTPPPTISAYFGKPLLCSGFSDFHTNEGGFTPAFFILLLDLNQ